MSNELAPTNNDLPDVTDDGLDLLVKQAQALEAAHKIGSALANTQMVPQTFRGKPDDAAAAILYGAELGLKPTQALQQVFVVHGQPAIYARTMVGLLKSKGYTFETVDTSDNAVTVRGTSPRGEVEESTWTIDRAKKAGYTGNKKYQSDPQAMLYAKAASEVSRKLAPDVLLGIRYTAEDLELEPRPVKATARRTDQPSVGDVRAQLTARTTTTEPDPEEVAEVDELSNILARIETAQDMDELSEIMGGAKTLLAEEEYDTARQIANAKAGDLNG